MLNLSMPSEVGNAYALKQNISCCLLLVMAFRLRIGIGVAGLRVAISCIMVIIITLPNFVETTITIILH